MQVETYLFGTVDVDPQKTILFPAGLHGLESSKRFMLIHEAGVDSPESFTLQSLDEPAIALEIADPTTFGFHYELALSDEESDTLQNPAAEDVAVMLVLLKQESEGKSGLGANFRAPLVINTRAKVGIQKVIQRPRSNITISNLSSPV